MNKETRNRLRKLQDRFLNDLKRRFPEIKPKDRPFSTASGLNDITVGVLMCSVVPSAEQAILEYFA